MHPSKFKSAYRSLSAGLLCAGMLLTAGPASAAVTVVGTGFARQCFEYAEANRSSDRGVENCDRALSEEALSVRDRAATHVNRGILHMKGKSLDDALADYQKAVAIKPDLAEAYVNQGIALVHLGGRDADAIAAISKGLSLNTARPEVAYYTRGVAHELLGNNRQAYEDYSQAAAIKPEWSEPKMQLQRFSVVRKKG
jgi:tetratricopeptide (TPR) repeat protein